MNNWTPKIKENWKVLYAPFTKLESDSAQPLWCIEDLKLIGITLLLCVFAAITLDETVYHWARESGSGYTQFHRWITDAGKSEWTLVPTGVLVLSAVIWKKELFSRFGARLQEAVYHAAFIFFTGAASGIFCNLLKNLIGRARPRLYESEGVLSFSPFELDSQWQSWPSGHSTTAAAFCAWVAFTFPLTRVVMVPVAALFCLSRIFANKHYLSDVIAGYVLGFLFVLVCARWVANRGMLFARTNSPFILERKPLEN